MAKNAKKADIYSYWVVEVNHTSGKAQIDFAATDFWISRIFSPESNVMYFKQDKDGLPKRNMVEINLNDPKESSWDEGRRIIEKALSSIRGK